MASIRESRGLVQGATQLAVAERSGVQRTRLSFAECNYLRLEPEEERLVREVIAAMARERYNHFLSRLRETN